MSAEERVGILIEVDGGEKALNLMEKLDQSINRLSNRKAFTSLSGLNKSKAELQGYINELERLKALQKTKIDAGLSTKSTDAAIQKITARIREMSIGFDTANTKARTLGESMRTTFNSISSMTMHAGQQLQVLGKTLTQISSPFRTLFRSTVFAAGFKALNMVTSGFSGAFERYDTMNNYTKSLSALGLDAEMKFAVGVGKAQTAIENLNDAVLGLPTGLDEIVAAQKVYAGATGEMVKSTKTAIAANNTFLASGTDAREQRFVQRYLASLASGAKLTTTQWQSMSRIAPLAMRAVAEELGYAGDKYQDFIKDVSNGTIAGEKFLDTFIKVGTEGKVQAAANVMKSTWEGLSANIQNASKRMGEGILKALDMAFETYNGRNLVQNLLGFDAEGNEVGGGIKHWINDISESVQNWIKANPDKIIDFFNQLKSLDVKGFLKGAAEGLGKTLETYMKLIKFFGGKDMEGFGRFMARAGFWGRSLNLFGGLLKGLRTPIAGIGTILTNIPAIKSKLGGKGIWGFFGNLLGKTKDAENVAKTATATGAASKGLLSAFKNIGLVAGAVTAISATGFVMFRSFKTMMKDLKEMTEIAGDMDWKAAAKIGGGMVVFFGAFAGLGALAGTFPEVAGVIGAGEIIVGLLATIASGFLALNMRLVKSAFNSFKDIASSLKEGLETLSTLSSVKINKGSLTNALQAFSDIQTALIATNKGLAYGGIAGAFAESALLKSSKKQIDNIASAIRGIKQAMNDLNNMPEITDIKGTTTKVVETVKSMRIVYENALTELNGEMAKWFGIGGALIESAETKQTNTMVTNIANVIGSIRGALDDFKALETLDVDFEEAKKNIQTVGEKMAEIYTAVESLFSTTQTTYGVSAAGNGNRVTTTKGIDKAQATNATNLATLFQGFSETIGYIKSAYQSIMGQGEDGFTFDVDAFKGMMEKLTGDGGIIPQMKSMYDSLTTDFGGGEDGTDIEGQVSAFANAIDHIKSAVTKLQEIESIEFSGEGGMAGVIDSIKQAVLKLSTAFSGETMATLTEQINAFKTNIATLKASLESIGGEAINIDIVIVPSLTGADETVNKLTNAYKGIKKARDNLAGLSMNIRLRFPISASLSGLDATVKAMYNAATRIRNARAALNAARGGGSITVSTGGFISTHGVQYRADGGSIFKKRGTDIVPAMLTPGEYVMNRKATKTFGIDFMRKVNNMDMQGALHELLTRAGGMASAGVKGTVINNNNYNNQRLVQNITTNNPNFAMKMSNRMVGAF